MVTALIISWLLTLLVLEQLFVVTCNILEELFVLGHLLWVDAPFLKIVFSKLLAVSKVHTFLTLFF